MLHVREPNYHPFSAAAEIPAAADSRSKSPAPTAEAGQSEDDRFGPPVDFEM